MLVELADTLTLAVKLLLTVTLRLLEVTGAGLIQVLPPLWSGVMTTVTTSLLVRVLVVKVACVAPLTFTPFTLHWNAGLFPPFPAVAVKVTALPTHTCEAGVAMLMRGAILLLILMLRPLEVTAPG
jgi:hypothetical protein